MVRTIKAKEKEKKKPGRKPKLIIEDQILMTLQYLREYRTYYHISKDWKISESSVGRIVHKIENILIKSRQFRLPGKKELWQSSLDGGDRRKLPYSKKSEKSGILSRKFRQKTAVNYSIKYFCKRSTVLVS